MTDTTPATQAAAARSAAIDGNILEALKRASQPLTQHEIAQRLSMEGHKQALWKPLRRLQDDGLIVHLEHCRYAPALRSRKTQLGRTVIYSDDPVAARRFLHTMHAEIARLQKMRKAKRLAREWQRK